MKSPGNIINHRFKALPLERCLAKTRVTHDSIKTAGRTVLDHCHIVGEVARQLRERMPTWLADSLFPLGSELIAAAHDIGKVSPTFQEKIYRGTEGYQKNFYPELKGVNPDLELEWGGHAGVSLATAEACRVGKYIPEILGQHHGYLPSLGYRSATAEQFGAEAWQEQRLRLIDLLKERLNINNWPTVQDEVQKQVLSGLTSVADWIGSGSLFEDPNCQDWPSKINTALDRAGFVELELRSGLSFESIFDFTPNKTQQTFIDHCEGPGIYILESPMGSGKTEAALYAAYNTMMLGKATGIYFALPTQLTSDKIHSRVDKFLDKILQPDFPHRKPLLLHGNAWLQEVEMGEEGQPGGTWFEPDKRCPSGKLA